MAPLLDLTGQQKQTKEFFEQYSGKWYENAKGNSPDNVNIVKIRNQYCENIVTQFLANGSSTLDVGCGTGDLVISLLKRGFNSYGIDFAPSMIEKAKIDAGKLNLATDKFLTVSFFDFLPKIKYDLISANGFIEYISENEFNNFLVRCNELLNKSGVIIVESRNRLFNVFSSNSYTKAEIELGEIEKLIEECIVFNNSKNLDELLKTKYIQTISKNLQQHEANTPIKVDTRYQYTPFQMIYKLQQSGFQVIDIMPYHIHGMTPASKDNKPEIHTKISYFLQDQKDVYFPLFPQASSFMISARKNE